jgi:hypothetical protein
MKEGLVTTLGEQTPDAADVELNLFLQLLALVLHQQHSTAFQL